MSTPQGSKVLHTFIRSHASPEEMALSWPPPARLKGEKVKMSVGLAGSALRCLTDSLKGLWVQWLQARRGGGRGKALLLRLGLWVVVVVGSLLHGAGSHRSLPGHQIVQPMKLSLRAGEAVGGEVSYALRVDGVNRIIHLRQKRGLVVKNLPVITYSPRGTRVVEQPHVPEECFYLGYVEGSPGSLATLSTCSGLRGQLEIGNLSYSIEPVPGSLTFQHLLYQREETQNKASVCGLMDEMTENQPGRMGAQKLLGKQDLSQSLKHTMYVEIFVVVDHSLFSFKGSNETSAMLLVIDTINLSETYYGPLKIRICLIGLEIWTQRDFISYSQDIAEVLRNFNEWVSRDLSRRMKYDIAHLFTYTDFGLNIGLAYIGGVCHPRYQSAVVSHIRRDFRTFTLVFTHELGHSLGMEHDRKECVCGEATNCHMSENLLHDARAFSNCSRQSYLHLLRRGDGGCLHNVPEPHTLFQLKNCGNKVIEEGEQCDCGGWRGCRDDPCCHHTCRLKPRALCSVGLCCQKCRFHAAGHKCRPEVDECDLPEYCNGTSEWCPQDLHVHDGTPCSNAGHCYGGRCVSYDKLCQKSLGRKLGRSGKLLQKAEHQRGSIRQLWGDGAEVAFVKCKPQDALCGRLQCVNVKRVPDLEGSETIIQVPGPEGWCWGTAYHAGIDTPDIGGGLDGTRCGPQKFCINKTCTDATARSKCDGKVLCGGKGVCNNLRQCHCEAGWAPPYCQFPGLGGSLDSGPPPPFTVAMEEIVHSEVFGMVIGMIVALALLIAVIKCRQAIAEFFSISLAKERSETPAAKEQTMDGEE